MTAIKVNKVSFGYDDKKLLKNIDFEVKEGSFLLLLGKNGSGKSTLLKLIAGILKPQSGTIEVFGKDVNRLSFNQRAKVVGFLPQTHNTLFPYTVEEVVITGRASYILYSPNERDREKASEALARVGILELRDKPYNQLSGGERQLVMIARVLAQEPKIILFDEPLTFLDIHNQIRFLSLVRELLNQGFTIVIVIHDLAMAARLDANYLMLSEGQVVAFGKRDILTKENILKVFHVEAFIDEERGDLSINLSP